MRTCLVLCSVLLALAVALPAPTGAGEPRTHDGFFLRLSAGPGYANTSAGSVDLSGLTGDYNFAIGGVVSRDLALHGTFFGWDIGDPDVEVNGNDVGSLDEHLALSAMGGGVTYYVMPANIYLSGSLALAWLSTADNVESDIGFGLDATLGKEWWVGGSWGLGLAAAFGYHSVPDEFSDTSWSGASFGLRFSATLN
jgi:hypothetical protein